uniref:Bestrophin homolog n=1 Tax=Alexandrium monilatum TaxID=311494 RepID=A0A7S4V4L9_9DINO
MIYYTTGFMNIFKTKGSVFPMSTRAALPCAIFSAILRWAINEGYCAFMEADDSIMSQTQAGWDPAVFWWRASGQPLRAFRDGCTATHHMRADWFDMASALISFTETSKAPAEKVAKFKHIIIRLVSMMHSCALMDLEEMNNKWGTTSDVKADQYDLLDPLGLDKESLDALYESKERVMLIFQWIQLMIVRNMEAGVLAVPPPILSRAYQELANGMVAFHECVKISDTPFPFPYAQTCELLLILHWVLVPFMVSQWVTQPFWALIFVFMQVFVLWSLNYLAEEIENPFGTDDNAIDGAHMQDEMNKHLLLLLHPKALRTPEISEKAIFSVATKELDWDVNQNSFKDIWSANRKCRRGGGPPAKPEARECRERMVATPRPTGHPRFEAQSPAVGAPFADLGARFPPELGMKDAFAIPLQEGKGDISHETPAQGRGSWEVLPRRAEPREAQCTSRSPPDRQDRLASPEAASGSDGSDGETDQAGMRSSGRSGSRRRQQRGRQQRL